MNWSNHMDKKQTKISPEILDVDSSRKPISLDGKKITQKHGLFFFEVTISFYFLFVLFFFLHFYSYEL